MDAWGGLHPFGINGPSPVSKVTQSAYWPNWNIARDLVLVPGNGNRSGYVLDGYGGLHPLHPPAHTRTKPAAHPAPYPGGPGIPPRASFVPRSGPRRHTPL